MKTDKNVLVVDDDPAHREMLKTLVSGWGYAVELASDGPEGVDMIKEKPFDIVLMDMRMIQMSGMEALEAIKEYNPSVPVIIMTAYSSVETAVESLKKGAYDYLTKPLDFEKLKLTLDRIVENIFLKQENLALKNSLGKQFSRENIIGKSKKMTELLQTVEMAAPTDANILISGESGTGKELIAEAVHQNSPRCEFSFIKINCAAITETLLESELFGHEKGAFTGADKKRMGLFQKAPAGDTGKGGDPGGRGKKHSSGCADHCLEQQGSQSPCRDRGFQGRSFFPAQRGFPVHASPAGKTRGYSRACPSVPGNLCPQKQPQDQRFHAGGHGRHDPV
jgi:two-component system response regulator HydG